ncbi:MAG: glycosyltransferase, partial [Holophagales bacterium]|nr:glycosyltransferase [Holophagales bacterium]
SWNDGPFVEETLRAVRDQTVPVQIIGFDNDSEDGTRETMLRLADEVVRVPKGTYVPGRVLNKAMIRSRGELVVFLNADCTPHSADWLEHLLEAAGPSDVAAAFSRQLPRPDCHPLEALDTERFYGNGAAPTQARHLFSMASSVIRREVWKSFPFDSSYRFSEDIQWTWRARQRGYRVAYAPSSRAFHSHNYSLKQLYRRQRGEGEAEASIFDWSPWQKSLLRYSVLPWGRQVLRDWEHCARNGHWLEATRSPIYRTVQTLGRRRGFSTALRRLEERKRA